MPKSENERETTKKINFQKEKEKALNPWSRINQFTEDKSNLSQLFTLSKF